MTEEILIKGYEFLTLLIDSHVLPVLGAPGWGCAEQLELQGMGTQPGTWSGEDAAALWNPAVTGACLSPWKKQKAKKPKKTPLFCSHPFQKETFHP